MEVTITGKRPTDPRDRVLAIEAATKAICQEVGEDPLIDAQLAIDHIVSSLGEAK